jgi:hypothetical protein
VTLDQVEQALALFNEYLVHVSHAKAGQGDLRVLGI